MNDYKQRLEKIKEINEANKTERTVLKERKANTEAEIEKLTRELAELDLTPETVEEYINKTHNEIAQSITKCEEILAIETVQNSDDEMEEEEI